MPLSLNTKLWNTNNVDLWVSMILYIIGLIMFILLCVLYVYLFIGDNKSKIHVIILISLILSMIYCILSFIFIDGNVLLFSKQDGHQYFYVNLISGIIVLQRTCIHVCNAYKLDISFNDSIFEVKKYKLILVYLGLSFICCVYFALIYIVRYTQINCVIISTTFIGSDILFSLISLRIFAVKIYKLLAIQMVPAMKFIVNKLTVLTMISTLSSIIFILIPVLLLPDNIKPYKLFCMDLIINNTCLIFSFGNASNLYRKLCCCFNCESNESRLARIISIAVAGVSPRVTDPSSEQNISNDICEIDRNNGNTNNNVDIHQTNTDKVCNINPTNLVASKQNNITTIKINSIYPSEHTLATKKKVSNSLQLPNKNISNSLGLPRKHYSNSLNVAALSSFDSLSVSQQIITDTSRKFDVLIPMTTVTTTHDSVDEFVSTMVEIQEPTGFEGNEVDTTNNTKKIKTPMTTPYDSSNNRDIDWNQLSIISDNNDDDTYETLKRNTPSTCVKQMKELGIIM